MPVTHHYVVLLTQWCAYFSMFNRFSTSEDCLLKATHKYGEMLLLYITSLKKWNGWIKSDVLYIVNICTWGTSTQLSLYTLHTSLAHKQNMSWHSSSYLSELLFHFGSFTHILHSFHALNEVYSHLALQCYPVSLFHTFLSVQSFFMKLFFLFTYFSARQIFSSNIKRNRHYHHHGM